jgi:hypothetical protein
MQLNSHIGVSEILSCKHTQPSSDPNSKIHRHPLARLSTSQRCCNRGPSSRVPEQSSSTWKPTCGRLYPHRMELSGRRPPTRRNNLNRSSQLSSASHRSDWVDKTSFGGSKRSPDLSCSLSTACQSLDRSFRPSTFGVRLCKCSTWPEIVRSILSHTESTQMKSGQQWW